MTSECPDISVRFAVGGNKNTVLVVLKLISADADPFSADGGNYEFSQIYYLSKN